MKYLTITFGLVILLMICGMVSAQDKSAMELKIPIDSSGDSARVLPADSTAIPDGKIFAYYFRSTRRCSNCIRLEAYSKDAIEKGFKKELESGKLEFKTINVDETENEHYVKDYQLYTKTLILSRVKDGKEVEWKNLDKIWKLLGNEKAYKEYVQTELGKFMGIK